MISPAPINYPSGTRPVAAGAGVQFATGPIHGMRTRDSLPALTMQNGTGTGSVAFTFQQVPAGAGVTGMKAGAC